MTWAFLLSAAALAAPEWDIPLDEPVVMHAAALDLELDGNIERALELLRAALELAPDEPMIAFDLARIAVEEDSDRFDDDVDAFMELEPDNDDARMLRAYILVRQGERQSAREQLNAMLTASPELGEATRLRDFVIHADAAAPTRWLAASLRVGVEADTNVTVVPDVATYEEGVRVATQANVTVVPVRVPTELTVSLALKYAPHLNNRDVLEHFDIISAVGLVRARQKLGSLVLTAQLSGNEVAIGPKPEQFMKDLFGDIELRYPMDALQIAVFGRGGYRDFSPGSPELFNPEGEVYDRDGWRTSLGILGDWSRGKVTVGARASFEAAETDGRWQRERGAEVGLYMRWRPFPWRAQAGVNWALRNFPTTGGQTTRMDNRFTSSLSCSRMLHDNLGTFGSVMWIKNLSSQGFDYDRVLAQVGVLAQW